MFYSLILSRGDLPELSVFTGLQLLRSYSRNRSKQAGCMVGSVILHWYCRSKVYSRWFFGLKTRSILYFTEMEVNWCWNCVTQDKTVTAHPSIVNQLTCQVIDRSKVVIDGNLITGKGLGTVIFPGHCKKILWPWTSEKCGKWNGFWLPQEQKRLAFLVLCSNPLNVWIWDRHLAIAMLKVWCDCLFRR